MVLFGSLLLAGCSLARVNIRYSRESTPRMDPSESVLAKQAALRDAGIVMPESFEALGPGIEKMYKELVESGVLIKCNAVGSVFNKSNKVIKLKRPCYAK